MAHRGNCDLCFSIDIFHCSCIRLYRQPEFCKWAFNVPRGQQCLEKWENIPDGVDLLITHTPPLGHGDLCCSGVRAGCVELLATVQKRVKPKYHVFGHIHEGNIVFLLSDFTLTSNT